MLCRSFHRVTGAVLLATTALATPALAQSAPAPRLITPDANGVDLVTGLPNFVLDEGGIGSGPGAVRMLRIWAQEAGWVDNWTGGMFDVGATTYVQVAGLSDTFAYAPSTGYTNTNATGATLVRLSSNNYLYTSRDGTTIEFDDTDANSPTSCPGADADTCQVPIAITKPSGLKFAIDWQENTQLGPRYFRLFTVKSSAGYRLEAEYVSNSIGSGPTPDPNWFRRSRVKFANLASSTATLSDIDYAYGSNTISVTDPANRTWTLTTDSNGRLTGIRRPGSSSDNISYSYSISGEVSSASKDGVTTGYSRSQFQDMITMTVTDALGKDSVVRSNVSSGRPSSFEDELDRVTEYSYYGDLRLKRITFPEDNYIEYEYGTRNNLTKTTRVAKPGAALPNIVTEATYTASCGNPKICNKPETTVDARGQVTEYDWNPTHGGLESVTAPAVGGVSPQTRYTYTAVAGAGGESVYMLSGISACQSLANCAGGSDETETTASYDSNLLPQSVSSGNGSGTLTATSAIDYDLRGNMISVDGPLPGTSDTWVYKYDLADQLTGTISPDPDSGGALLNRAVRITYRPDGQVTKQERGTTTGQSDAQWQSMVVLENLETLHDSNSRPYLQRLWGSNNSRYAQTQMSYDALGRLECTAVRMDRNQFSNSADLGACTLGSNTAPPDRIAKLIYDDAGQVLQNRVAVGVPGEEAAERTLAYTGNGLVQSLTDAENNKTTYGYDGHDRLSRTQFPVTTKGANQSNPNDDEVLTYEVTASGTRTSGTVASFRNRDDQLIGFAYDALGRLTHKDLPGSSEPDVTYAYDNLGRLTSATQTGNSLSFSYDALGRNLTQSGPHGTICSEWDLAGRRTRLRYPGPANCTGSFYMDYDYLATGEMRRIRELGAASGIGVLATFGYDDLGNRNRLWYGNGAITQYAYDPVSRLSELTLNFPATASDVTTTFAHNPAAQITSQTRSADSYAWTSTSAGTKSYTIDGLNRVTAIDGSAVSYDPNKNVTAEPQSGKSYLYTSENLLRYASGGGVPAATLTSDPLMRLYEVSSASGTTKFSYDGLEVLTERDAASALQRRFVWGPGIDEPLVWYEGAGTTDRRWLHADERGSIVAISDDSGAVTNINRYDEFGIPAATNIGRFQYTGQAWLPEIDAYYYKARVYAPQLGRFLQPDPLGYWDSPNLYTYVLNDPVNLVDPLGLQRIQSCWTVSAGVGVGDGALDWSAREVCGSFYIEDTFTFAPPELTTGGGGGGVPQSAHDGCPAPAITPAQRQAAQNGDRTAFWNSRLAAGDPLARTALSIVNNSDFLGQYANFRLRQAIITRSPTMGPEAISREVQQIGVQLMQAHVAAIDDFGSPTTGDIADYHRNVFNAHGLPGSTFGGTMILGSAGLTNLAMGWAGCRF